VAGGAEDPLKSHRCEITVVFLDLRWVHRVRGDGRTRGADGPAAPSTTRRWAASSSLTRARSSASPATA
jgi:hypothetical protein